MTASMMSASVELPTALDRYRSHGSFLGGIEQNPGGGSARIDGDCQLLEALRLREPTAAEQLVATYGDRAYRLAVRITGNQEDAQEAVQDAFWSVIHKIDTFRGNAALGSWIYRVTVNAAIQTWRRGARRRHEISLDEILPAFDEHGRYADAMVDWSTELHRPVMQSELRNVLTSALEELPDHYRAVIILRDVEALSMAEVADCLNITVPTVKTRAHRARLFLRQRLAGFMSGATSGARRERAHDCGLEVPERRSLTSHRGRLLRSDPGSARRDERGVEPAARGRTIDRAPDYIDSIDSNV